MSANGALEVKVIFDASSRGRRRRGVIGLSRRRSRPFFLVALGMLNLIAAVAAYSFTWWKADPFLYMIFMMHTPVPGLSVDAVDDAFANAPGGGGLNSIIGEVDPPVEQAPASAPTIVGLRATTVIGITSYAWLTIATLTACALALAAGSALGKAGGSGVRRAGFILLIGVIALLAFGVFQTWSELGRHCTPRHLRIGMGGLAAIALMLGTVAGGKSRRLSRLAAILTILGGVATAVALYLGNACGAIDARYATPIYLAMVFVGVSAWGWLLLPLGSRWTR